MSICQRLNCVHKKNITSSFLIAEYNSFSDGRVNSLQIFEEKSQRAHTREAANPDGWHGVRRMLPVLPTGPPIV